MVLCGLIQSYLYFFICKLSSYLTGNTCRPPRSITGIDILFYVKMMFVPHKKYTYGPPRSVTVIALKIFEICRKLVSEKNTRNLRPQKRVRSENARCRRWRDELGVLRDCCRRLVPAIAAPC
jgi:DNA-directed RNA polymerase subunit N (RpoN/RPB10)